jgi:hypothetical protein
VALAASSNAAKALLVAARAAASIAAKALLGPIAEIIVFSCLFGEAAATAGILSFRP